LSTATASLSNASRDPRTGETREGSPTTSSGRVAALVATAASAAEDVAGSSPCVRERWLVDLAESLELAADELVDLADAETALGQARLRGELSKTAAQARFYGAVAAEGSWLSARVDTVAGPPAMELRRANLPVGPVAVFGASNFPFSFGAAGHDTLSALAAGCPVLVKAHPAHPLLSVRLGQVVAASLAESGAPLGAFGLVVGFDAGLALVDAPEVRAVAFTGSQAAGMALVERAGRRPEPIPVFAEMGTVNPVVVTPAAARADLAGVAEGFVGSFTLGQGQFCTKPGLLLAPAGVGAAEAVAAALSSAAPGWLLTEGMAASYESGLESLLAAGARRVGQGGRHGAGFAVAATVLAADINDLQPGSRLLGECFGPVALVVEYDDLAQLRAVLGRLQPSLAAAVATVGADDPDAVWLVAHLSTRVGRVVVNGWPTGVMTSWAQQHGGPWPATNRPDATSVGAAALDRFTRPVAFQDLPDAALPMALRADNPWRLARRVNGVLEAPERGRP
jgi:NADP-dependent aldehyde dehydrogenase